VEWLAGIPDWVVWFAAGGVGVLVLLMAVNTLETVLDLEHD
jgi:hypothetical protein